MVWLGPSAAPRTTVPGERGRPPPNTRRTPPAAGGPAGMVLALQRTAGNRAVAAAVQRTLTNDATWGAVDATTGQGTSVVAIVGPGYAYGSGPKTKPGFRPYDYTNLFSTATEGAFYCQGHLLNDNLGGPGDPNVAHAAENLTAFPQRPTNTDHNKAIEQWIKAVDKTKLWFRYTVSIGYSTDSAARLRRRLGANAGLAAGAGIAATATTFSYASGLYATWDELVQGKTAANNAPPLKPGGISGTLSISIPSPMTYVGATKRAGEYPGYVKRSWEHLPTMKGSQTSGRTGVLPPKATATAKQPPSPGRPFVIAVRWQATNDARAGVPLAGTASAVYQAGYNHYNDGVTASRAGPPATRYGRGYTMGYQDFEAGLTHGRANLQAKPPTPPPKATVDGHNEFWAGVLLGLTKPLATPPTGNRAHVAGHADYWAGVDHGTKNAKATAPKNLGEAAGHNHYWEGVEFAEKNPRATKPAAGNLAILDGHTAYWKGADVARADPTTAPPLLLGELKGHTDFIDGGKHAQGNPRGTPPAAGLAARTEAWTEYWEGVDFGQANPPATAYTGASSAAKVGIADYRAGVAKAVTGLPALLGAPPAAGTAIGTGFADYHEGVLAFAAGTPAIAKRSGHAAGWEHAQAGDAEAAKQVAAKGQLAPSSAEAGFLYGFSYRAGVAAGQADLAATPPAGGSPEATAVAATGLAAYTAGYRAGKAGGPATTDIGGAAGHADYQAGLTHAKANPRGTPPAAGAAARTAAFTEYWQGVDAAQKVPRGGVPPTGSAASDAGVADYWAGVDQAAGGLAALLGAAPTTGGNGIGFGDYHDGVLAFAAGTPAVPARAGHSTGHQHAQAGDAEAAHQVATKAKLAVPRTEAGFVYGFSYRVGVAAGQADLGSGAPSGGSPEADAVAAAGLNAYTAGYQAGKAGGPATTDVGGAAGHADYQAGLTHAKANNRATAPAGGSATKAAFAEYWTGVDSAQKAARGTVGPTGSAATDAGVADYWTGVDQAAGGLPALLGPAPTTGGAGTGFGDYHDGVLAFAAGTPAIPARTGHATGHQHAQAGDAEAAHLVATQAPLNATRNEAGCVYGFSYRVGVAAGQADLGAGPPAGGSPEADAVAAAGLSAYTAGYAAGKAGGPATADVGGAAGHADYQSGLSHAKANNRATAPAGGSATKAAFAEYWTGVDAAQKAARGTVGPSGSAATDAGAADYWSGVDQAAGGLPGLLGAALAGGAGTGFGDYHDGVLAFAAGAAAVPARAGHSTGHQHAQAGDAEAAHLVATKARLAASRTEAGFVYGFSYRVGVAAGQADLGAGGPTGVGPEADAVAAAGLSAYTAGYAAGRAGGPATADVGGAAGHADYQAGLTHAKANNRATPPAGPSAAQAAFTEYWQGVDAGQRAPRGSLGPSGSAATDAGVADYWTGVDQAAGGLPALLGPAPTAGGNGTGFVDYHDGVLAFTAGTPAIAARAGHTTGHQHAQAGNAQAAHLVATQAALTATRTEAGFLYGFSYRVGVAAGQADLAAAAPTGAGLQADAVAAAGLNAYTTGYQAGRAGGPATADLGAAAGHADYQAGLTYARANPRVPPAGTSAFKAAFAEYWQGVDAARHNPPNTLGPSGSAATDTGVADFWAGVAHARANLAQYGGPAPGTGGGLNLGFGDYTGGAADRAANSPNQPAFSGWSIGWTDFDDGVTDKQNGAVNPGRTHAAYLDGSQPFQVGGKRGTGTAPRETKRVRNQ